MAKTGLAFYKAETERFRDRKVRKLVKHFGCNGYAVYEYVLNEIYRVKGCFVEWDEDTAFDVAEYFGIKESRVIEIVNYCAAVGLYDKELLRCGRVLTSKAIQERYFEACKIMKRATCPIPDEISFLDKTSKIPGISAEIQEESAKTPEVFDREKRNQTKRREKEPNCARDSFHFSENLTADEAIEASLEAPAEAKCRAHVENLLEELKTKWNEIDFVQPCHFLQWPNVIVTDVTEALKLYGEAELFRAVEEVKKSEWYRKGMNRKPNFAFILRPKELLAILDGERGAMFTNNGKQNNQSMFSQSYYEDFEKQLQ